jgi:hypothetical protein
MDSCMLSFFPTAHILMSKRSYTASDSGTRSTTLSCDDPRITYSPRGVWTTNSTNLPSCAISKSGVRVTSTPNATFPLTSLVRNMPPLWPRNFDRHCPGDTVFVHTINSPRGGKLSLSVNGGPPQIYDTYANATRCGTSHRKRC